MKRIIAISVLVILATLILNAYNLTYSEQVQRDMFASVVVLPTFKLSLDNASINFGYAEPGKTIELNPYAHYNEVRCKSNKGKTWYLKVSVTGNIIGPEDSNVGIDSFKWQVVSSSGDGVAEQGWQSFSQTPVRVYTSGERDALGEEVVIRFKYKLDMPQTAKGGNYSVNVLYTMTDMPI